MPSTRHCRQFLMWHRCVHTYAGNQLNSTSMEFNYTETDKAIKMISFASFIFFCGCCRRHCCPFVCVCASAFCIQRACCYIVVINNDVTHYGSILLIIYRLHNECTLIMEIEDEKTDSGAAKCDRIASHVCVRAPYSCNWTLKFFFSSKSIDCDSHIYYPHLLIRPPYNRK